MHARLRPQRHPPNPHLMPVLPRTSQEQGLVYNARKIFPFFREDGC